MKTEAIMLLMRLDKALFETKGNIDTNRVLPVDYRVGLCLCGKDL